MPVAVRIFISMKFTHLQRDVICIWTHSFGGSQLTGSECAGRQESAPRTFKEICTVTVGATKTEVGRTYKVVVKQLEQAMGTIHAADCMRRFCSHLGLQHSDMKAAADVAEEACPRHMQRCGLSATTTVTFWQGQVVMMHPLDPPPTLSTWRA